jgi:hypothetical protein
VPLGNYASVQIPGRTQSAANAGTWVAESAPITVRPLATTPGATLLPRKLMVIQSYTREAAVSSLIEDIIKQTVSEAAALVLDAALFGTQAQSAAQPRGLLNGVTPITGTSGGGVNAMSGDFRALFSALAANGAGKAPLFAAAPQQVASLKLMAGPKFDFEVLSSAALAAGTVVAVEPSSLVSGFDPVPQFDVGQGPAPHFDDAATDISTPPATVAAPVKSLWQTDSLALRMILRAAWAMRASGHVQVVTGASW